MDQDGYLFFWGGIHSQWCTTRFEENGKVFTCCEQYMMYHKAMLFNDKAVAQQILREHNPREMKRLGRLVKKFDARTWDKHKFNIVYRGNLLRALQDQEFRDALIASGNRVIVEASPYDRVWGIGYDAGNALQNKDSWGENLLGKVQMQVRDVLA